MRRPDVLEHLLGTPSFNIHQHNRRVPPAPTTSATTAAAAPLVGVHGGR